MMPRSIEAEQAVLGSILIDSRCLEEIVRVLRPQDFAVELNRVLYQVMLQMDRAGQQIDPVTVKQAALRAGLQLDDAWLLALMDLTPTAANAGAYAGLVREAALDRGAASVSEYITRQLKEHRPVSDVLTGAARQIEELQREGTTEDLLDPDGAMLTFYAHRERVTQEGASTYVRTGYQDLDRQLGGGMLNSGMYVLAARPGMGKTTLAINIADRVAQTGKTVLFVSLEMEPEQIEAKRLARETGISANRLLMDRLTDEEENAVARAVDVIRELPVHFNRRDTVTVAQIEVMARRIRGLDLIVIDYIGKILPELRGRSPSRTEYMTEISGELKNLARRFHVPVLALCQLNRAGADRKDPRPVLTDLRDTGAIEQDADGVIFLHRKDYYQPQAGRAVAELLVIVAKNRHGTVGDCALAFDLAGSKMTTSRWRPAPQTRSERLGPTQMTFEELTDRWDLENPFAGEKPRP